MISDDEEIEVPGVGGHAPRRVARRLLSDIIEPRVEEIFSAVRQRMEETGLIEQINSGCVLTGGGALMEGMVECAEEILGMPVRLGFPIGLEGMHQLVQGPQYSTGVGLVRFGKKQLMEVRGREQHGSSVTRVEERTEVVPRRSQGFWNWFRAAF
jgi:cell division protein FtsA